MRRISLMALAKVMVILCGWLAMVGGCGSAKNDRPPAAEDKKTAAKDAKTTASGKAAPQAAAAAVKVPERASPIDLIGTWKRSVAIDEGRLEAYLQRNGDNKAAVPREKLIDELKKLVSDEVTLELRIDGVMVETRKRADAKPFVQQGQWKVLRQDKDTGNVDIEIQYVSRKGLSTLVSAGRPTVVFEGRDRFMLQDPADERMPLTAPVFDRIARGSLEYSGSNGNPVPPPFRKKPEPLRPELIAKLKSLGVAATIDGHGEIVQVALDERKGAKRFDPKTVLPLLDEIATLRIVYLTGGRIKDDDLVDLASHEGLEILGIGYNEITDAGLEHLRKLSAMRQLNLEKTAIGDAGMAPIRAMTKLVHLNISRTKVGDAGLVHLAELIDLERFEADQTRITGKGLLHLSGLVHMRMLSLAGTAVNSAGLVHLKGMPQLGYLDLTGTPVGDGGLAHLASLARLRELRLGDTQVGDDGLVNLKNLSALEDLNLNGTGVTDAGIERLKGLKQLKKLRLYGTKVTAQGAAELGKALPDCTIFHR